MSAVLLLTATSVVVAIPVLLRGRSSAKVSLVVLALLVAMGATIVLATRVHLDEDPDRLGPLLTRGIAATGVVAALAAGASAVMGGDVGWVELTVAGISIAVILCARPVGHWLASDGRITRFSRSLASQGWTFLPPSSRPFARLDAVMAAIGVIALGAGLAVVLPDGPFGHDESIYALKARSWIEDTPTTGWAIYRPIGMSVIGWLVLQVSSTEAAFRSAAVVLSLATIASMWFAGRIMYDRLSATIGTAVFVGTESFLRRATEFLNDVGSAGLLLAAMLAVWYQFERKPNGWWIVTAAPLGALAYYLRYGSALGLAIIAVVAAAIWWRRLGDMTKQLIVTAITFVALLLPHFWFAIDETGSPIGVFQSARTSVGGGGGGLADYLRWLPSSLAGPLGTALLAIAVGYLVFVVAAARRDGHGFGAEVRTVAYLVITAIVLTFALGAFTHGEPRFVYLPLMLMMLTGARAGTVVWTGLRSRWRAVSAAVAAVVLAVGFAAAVRHVSPGLADLTDARGVLVEAATVARNDAGAGECTIRSTYIPQLTWYAACSTFGFTRPVPESRPAYLAVFDNGKRQPTGQELLAEVEAADQPPIAVVPDPYDKIGDGAVYRYP